MKLKRPAILGGLLTASLLARRGVPCWYGISLRLCFRTLGSPQGPGPRGESGQVLFSLPVVAS